MRIFTAVELPGDLRARLAAAAAEFLWDVPSVRRVAAENVHVTVRFLGEVEPDRIDGLEAALGAAAAAVAPGSARLRGFGAFPSPGRPRVFWGGVDDTEGALVALEAGVSHALEPLGFPREDRVFHPHATVARVRHRRRGRRGQPRSQARIPDLGPPPGQDFGPFPVHELTLFHSELTGDGVLYTALARLPLGVGTE